MIKNKDKAITGAIALCLVLTIFSIGYLSLTGISSSITESGQVPNNCSVGVVDSGASMYNVLLPFLVIGVVCLIGTILFYSVSSAERFSRFGMATKFLIATAYYFGYGVIFIIILAVPSYMIYALYNFAVVEGNTVVTYEMLKWIGIATVAFFGIGGLGYIFKKYFVDKLKERLGEKEYETNIKELPKVTE